MIPEPRTEPRRGVDYDYENDDDYEAKKEKYYEMLIDQKQEEFENEDDI